MPENIIEAALLFLTLIYLFVSLSQGKPLEWVNISEAGYV